MYDYYNIIHICILLSCGLVCCLLAFFARSIQFHSIRKKRTLIELQLGCAVLMIADAVTQIYRGDMSTSGIILYKVGYFFMFALIPISQIFLNAYLVSIYVDSGKIEEVPLHLKMGFIFPTIGLAFIALTPILGLYYYFDAYGVYYRGPWFLLGYLMPFITFVIQLVFVLLHKTMINSALYRSILFYSMFPVVASVTQIFIRGWSLINLSMFVSAIVIFWCALMDQNHELSKAVNTEILTGLPNGSGFQREIDRIMVHGDIMKYNGYYFDIVRMSQINSKYGKTKGDEILIKYATALKKELDDDEILGRLGGNYFVALVKKTNTEKFLKLIGNTSISIDVNGREEIIHISAIAGCYEIKSKHLPTGKIMGTTAAAVSYAKNIAKKPYVFFDDELEEEFKRKRQLEEATHQALIDGEFEPFYQPKVDCKTQSLVGAEALVRWRRGNRIVTPYEFVPVMENDGSICELDFYMLERVCMDIRKWIDNGILPVPVSVNFSRRNLGNENFAEDISQIVAKYDIPRELVQIEVTETLDEHPMEAMVKAVEDIHDKGLKVAIDDFGTGSSSIKLLKEVKFDVMKIDKSFVDYKNEIEKKILMDIIHMADNIGIDVVAEGVEEEFKVKELADMGCFEIQGYYYDKPLEKSDFERKLENKVYQNK